ncbi:MULTISPECIES: inositol-3-phosphate synthase [Sphingobium]|uniref:Inositol-3-phosphate synthase n=1 Tax=Sphingobium fuliginis (strain ATCC 27551) TaxID=336203 RepID=A0ABQ1EPR6_SPHSA|nr:MULTISPECIES: inositol-3-phosphate synthase [Sphingobium]AJR25954.1 inositol-3-phosphate synthase [Sphingobium sp. YBL2]RYM00674.1 inositol-3-phosphate synthase [Sphingobium fuliginis]UXC89262.1 inositol-3-phosphate synthase [Sphingobium sp. RSMS]WDA38152.1 inositol-3-phosphate synthase [Sphingobium sp. YC-XJ3]GFZ81487.1 inositol-3-phosphate synthase [Sphingobium fuliginis]
MQPINIGIVGVGNCASSLVQGLSHYRAESNDHSGLMHWELGGYRPCDIRLAAAWDIDRRKVGRDIAEAIFARPNCTQTFCGDVRPSGVKVEMGRLLDGCADHMADHPDERTFLPADAAEPDRAQVIERLREAKVDVLLNYLPVGSQQATEFYAQCALEAGVAFVNNIPVFIASDPAWADRFERAGVPIIGDDIKAQLGATIVHRVLTDLFAKRGVKLDRTYQLNTGGNTDFLNMSNRSRLKSKKISKTEAVQSVAETRLEDENIHIGPSDYVAWQNDNKVCFLRMEGQLFGGVPMNLELRLSVEDSPNSAGVAIDMIRCAKIALDRGLGGPIHPAAAYFCKHPPMQMTDDRAHEALEAFIRGEGAIALAAE